MQKRDAPSKKVQFVALVIIIAVTATILGCRGDKPAVPTPQTASVAAPAAVPTPGKH